MKKQLTFLYSLLCYLICLGVFFYTVAFLGNWFVPESVDFTQSQQSGIALWINVGLIARLRNPILMQQMLTGWWTRYIPAAARRSTFVLFSSVFMALILWNWRPMPALVWQVGEAGARLALEALSVGGWLLVLASTFLVDHFRLLGLRQGYLYLHGRPCSDTTEPRPVCRWARHALLAGLLTALWATPVMTMGHLIFAASMTAYALVRLYAMHEHLARWGNHLYQLWQGKVASLRQREEANTPGHCQRPASA